jgi:hypothetical protein
MGGDAACDSQIRPREFVFSGIHSVSAESAAGDRGINRLLISLFFVTAPHDFWREILRWAGVLAANSFLDRQQEA